VILLSIVKILFTNNIFKGDPTLEVQS